MSSMPDRFPCSANSVSASGKPKFVFSAPLAAANQDCTIPEPEKLKLATPNSVTHHSGESDSVAPEIPSNTHLGVSVANDATQAPIADADCVADVYAADGVAQDSSLLDVSNSDFVAAIFSALPKGASAVVCSKHGDPTTGSWVAKPATQVQATCLASSNNYFNCSSFRPDADGSMKARVDHAAAFYCLVLDDVGTKAPLAGLGEFKPSWVTETSSGNFQVGFILAQPLTSADEVTRLQNAAIAAGLCDPGATGMARWMRLPVGVNGKVKYADVSGKPFHCRLVQWHPEVRYTFDELVAGLKLEMASVLEHVPQAPNTALASDRTAAFMDNRNALAKIALLLDAVDSDCPYPDWVRILMAVHDGTGGSDAGLALVNSWSSKGRKYKGVKDVEANWRSFEGRKSNPVTIGTLIKMAGDAGVDVASIMRGADECFEPCDTEVVKVVAKTPATAATVPDTSTDQSLTKFSLRDSLAELEKHKVEQVLIFGEVVLLGQATVIYALANTGKTLILIYLIIEAVKKGRIDPSKLIYINMDDNSSGLVDKVRLASEYGFHMAADGHKGFSAREFRAAMEKMIMTDTAHGAIVVLDTLKKFVNTMNKEQSAEFARIVRQFCLKGGTVIALSHANKNPGVDGKIKYTGTTDIVDDFDCAYTLETISAKAETSQKVVEFTNIKRRGDVVLTAAYSYATERGLSYNELVLSVQDVDPLQLGPIKQAVELQSDATVITALEACIAEGINTKMKMIDAASKRASASNRATLKVLDKYTGDDTSLHHWTFVVRERGAKVYELLERAAAEHTAKSALMTP